MDFLQFDEAVWERVASLLEYDAASPITLVSGFFLFAFVLFWPGYIGVVRRQRLRTLYIVLFSLYFYYKLSGTYLLLLLFVALSDYCLGRLVGRSLMKGGRGRAWVVLSVAINVSILVYFKATGFFADVLNDFCGNGTVDMWSVAVPAGVSFFVFQSLAYVVDISRGTIKPLVRFDEYLFLLSFFPKMFLGPLVKAKDFIPQMQNPRINVSRDDMGRAAMLIAGGIFKYSVVAKLLGVLLVKPAMAGEMGDGGFVALVAVYGFAIQIYCDFSGYSDVASGIALLMGFRLPDNFNAPYKSATITEFWRRWHISLSTWLRDYLYISLGGNRKGKVRTYLNLVITMFLGGLWHGVSLTFMLWGLFHGVALALHKLWLAYVPGAKTAGEQMRPVWRSLGMVLTFHIVCFGWLLFMADDMAQVEQVLHNIAFNFSFDEIVPVIETSVVAFAVLGLGFLMHFLPQRVNDGFMYAASRSGVVGQAMVLVAVVWLSMQCDMLLAANSVTPDNLPMYASY